MSDEFAHIHRFFFSGFQGGTSIFDLLYRLSARRKLNSRPPCSNKCYSHFNLGVSIQQASKVAVKTFVAADQLVGEGKARHETSLLQPEDRTEGAREEDPLHSSEGDESVGKGIVVVLE